MVTREEALHGQLKTVCKDGEIIKGDLGETEKWQEILKSVIK